MFSRTTLPPLWTVDEAKVHLRITTTGARRRHRAEARDGTGSDCVLSRQCRRSVLEAATAPAAVTHAIHISDGGALRRPRRRRAARSLAEDLRPARGLSRSDGGVMARGARRHLVTLQAPTTGVDADGHYTQTWTDLVPPTWFVSIEPATTADLERVAAGIGDQLGLASRAWRLSARRDDADPDAL